MYNIVSVGNRLSDSSRPRPLLPLASEPKLSGVPINQSLTSPLQPVSYSEIKVVLGECIISFLCMQVSPYQHTVDELIHGVEYPAKVIFTGRSYVWFLIKLSL